METKRFFIDDWLVEPALGQVTNRLRTVRLEPQVMKVLVYLVSHRGDVVTKQEIIDALWQRRYTSDAALSRCISTIRRVLGDDRKQPRFIQTIPKIGYKMVARVTEPGSPVVWSKRRLWAAAAAVLFAAGALALSYPDAERTTEISNTVVETVGVGEDALFVNSLASILAVELRNEITAAGGRVISAEDSLGALRAKGLGGSHRLDSRINVEGSNISIDIGMADKSNSSDRWQRRFFMDTSGDIETVSDIVHEVIAALDLPGSSVNQANRLAPATSSIVAYDLYLKGVESFRKLTRGSNLAAIALFESALEHDDDYGLAYAGLSAALTMQIRYWDGNRRDDALSTAIQAIEREPGRAESHYALGEALSMDLAERERALESFARALAIDPGHIEALRSSAALFQLGRDLEAAVEHYNRALDLEPRDHYTMLMLGSAYFEMGDFDNAHHWLAKSYRGAPYSVKVNSQLAMLDLMDGATAKAINRCDRLMKLNFASYSCMRIAAASSIVAGDMSDARSRFDAMSELWPDDGYVRLGQAFVLLSENANDQAQEIIDCVLERAYASIEKKNNSVKALRVVAVGYALLGQTPKAYETLNSAAEIGRTYDPWDEIDPLLAALRRDRRFDLYIAANKPLYR